MQSVTIHPQALESVNAIRDGVCQERSETLGLWGTRDGLKIDRNLETNLVNPLEEANWDELVLTCPEHSFFCCQAWARVLSQTYGFSPCYLVRRQGDRLSAMLPMMEVRSWLTGRRGVGLPFSDYLPWSARPGKEEEQLVNEALDLGRERSWKYVEIKGGCSGLVGARPALRFWKHHLDLRAGEQSLLSGLKSSARRAIRKAEKCQVTVKKSTAIESVRIFYQLHCQTRKRHGVPPQAFSFFANIAEHVLARNFGHVWIAYYRDQPISAAIFAHFGKRALYKFGASDFRCQHLRPNNLLMWEAIKHYATQGFESLDFGKTALANEGLRRFKKSFSPVESELSYYRYDLLKERFVNYSDPIANRVAGCLRRMPVFFLRMMGRMLYRHVA